MFRREKLPTMTLFIILVLALAAVGVGYGLWSKLLYIRGTVATGNVDAELSIMDVNENDHGKDVGVCDAELVETNQPRDTLVIRLSNTYPSYECAVIFDVHSTGSIPIHIYQPIFDLLPNPEEVTVRLVDCYRDDTQLHRGEMAYCTIYIHVEQAAQQLWEYVFSATVEARQFNEPRP